jgi:hypothetical protein
LAGLPVLRRSAFCEIFRSANFLRRIEKNSHFCADFCRSAQKQGAFCAPFALFLFCLFCAFSIRVKLYFNYQFSHTVITNIVPKHSSARSAIAHTYFSRYFDPPLRITI